MGGVELGSRWDTGKGAFGAGEAWERLGDTFSDSLLTFGLTNLPAATHNIGKSYNSLAAAGEARLLSGQMPTEPQLQAMNLSESEALGHLAVMAMDDGDSLLKEESKCQFWKPIVLTDWLWTMMAPVCG